MTANYPIETQRTGAGLKRIWTGLLLTVALVALAACDIGQSEIRTPTATVPPAATAAPAAEPTTLAEPEPVEEPAEPEPELTPAPVREARTGARARAGPAPGL